MADEQFESEKAALVMALVSRCSSTEEEAKCIEWIRQMTEGMRDKAKVLSTLQTELDNTNTPSWRK